MPRPEFRKPNVRRRPTPIIELLEGRQLLNATASTKPPAVAVHAEVAKLSAEEVKQEKAEAKEAKLEKAEAIKLATQEKAEAAKEAKQEKAAATKLAKQEKAELTALNKQEEAAEKKAIAASPLAKDKIVKVGPASMDLYKIEPTDISAGTSNATPLAGVYTPQQVETAYGTNYLPNQGQGITIGIVDEYDDSTIINDANVYSSTYGLPTFNSGGPTLTVIKDTDLGGTVPPSPTSGNADVTGETSIDVELAHAMAPQANIVLIETVNSAINDLLEGIQDAVTHGAAVVSLSYGGGEGASSITSNTAYLAPGTINSGAAVTVSTGDSSTPEFPATSPNVIAVGGTSLFLASAQGAYGYETAWGGYGTGGYSGGAGGGGPSKEFAAPTYQSANGVKLSTFRTIPDVSLVADPFTAVSVYDSYDGSDWTAFGGTSVASPMFAGVIALAQQDRVTAGQQILTSAQIDTALYTAYTNPTTYADIFNDVTLGKNSDLSTSGRTSVAGYSATTGYDLATGLGSPWADYMVPYLAYGIDPGA